MLMVMVLFEPAAYGPPEARTVPNELVMVQVVSSRLLPLKRFTVISPVNPPDALAVPLSTVDVCPPQSVTSGPASTVGKGLTYTVTWSWLVQVPWVAVSVYVVVVVGLAVGFRMVAELNAVAGLQV